MNKKKLFRGFWSLCKGYWLSVDNWKSCVLLAIVIVMTCESVLLELEFNYWQGYFSKAFQHYQREPFELLMEEFCKLTLMFIVINTYAKYLQQKLQIKWRTWMTDKYLAAWLSNKTYYKLQSATDNPDQRIAEDIDKFVDLTLSLTIGFISQTVTIVLFGMVLWKFSGTDTFMGIVIPGYMFWFALIYSGIGACLVHKVGRKLIGLNFDQQRYEADFRFSMMRVRENSESIAFYRGEPAELDTFKEKFSVVIKNFWQIMRKTKHLNFFVKGYNQLSGIAPYIIFTGLIDRYFDKAFDMQVLTQTLHAFIKVQGAFSYFVTVYDKLATLAAVINRLDGFTEHMDEAQKIHSNVKTSTASEFKVADLNISLPTGRELLKKLSLELQKAKSLLVTGASGCGKSTLLRTLAGIWAHASGEISLPPNARVMFLPQKPYLPLGTLRRALIYPAAEKNSPPDEKLKATLRLVELPALIDKLDVADDWSRILSLGEQQRLAFARVLLSAPDYIFLDETTSALDEPRELEMYKLLRVELPDVTIVSVGHRSTLFDMHDTELNLDGTGNYVVRALN